jgi:predicted NAD/FAD-dependent oxidoreductase
LPDNQIDLRQGIAAQSFAALEQCGLYLSGDYLLGKGRVAFALSEGFALANKIAPKI